MGLEASKKEEREQIMIEIVEYDNFATVLSKMLIPFSEVMGASSAPDVYSGTKEFLSSSAIPLIKVL